MWPGGAGDQIECARFDFPLALEGRQLPAALHNRGRILQYPEKSSRIHRRTAFFANLGGVPKVYRRAAVPPRSTPVDQPGFAPLGSSSHLDC
jgi:hypothetical protein